MQRPFGLHSIFLEAKDVKTRSISAENPTGAKGAGALAEPGADNPHALGLGKGWKVSPCLTLPPGAQTTLAEMEGPGLLQHIWITVHPSQWRRLILRIFWDGEVIPSVAVPLGDFFCNGWGKHCQVNSQPVAVNPMGGFNSYWPMPFKRHARITIENMGDEKVDGFFFQVTYALCDLPENTLTFHAAWNRSRPVAESHEHVILEDVQGAGQFVGLYMALRATKNWWWGEGEVKFFLDGDQENPTICGTGTEDYFGGAWCFLVRGRYRTYTTPYLGMPQVLRGWRLGLFPRGVRFGLYRWHILDPVCFSSDLRVTVQDLGFDLSRKPHGFFRKDDIATTAFWYQHEPHQAFNTTFDRSVLRI
jgi:hypothetical protein